VKLTIHGPPRTKKTSNQVVLLPGGGKGQPCPHCKRKIQARVFPSKFWRQWLAKARLVRDEDGASLQQVKDGPLVWVRPAAAPGDLSDGVIAHPLTIPAAVRATFFRERRGGDWQGYVQGLADLLEHRGIVANDALFASWDGTRLDLDRTQPRVELEITPYEDPRQVAMEL
jgi:hypothetical protein